MAKMKFVYNGKEIKIKSKSKSKMKGRRLKLVPGKNPKVVIPGPLRSRVLKRSIENGKQKYRDILNSLTPRRGLRCRNGNTCERVPTVYYPWPDYTLEDSYFVLLSLGQEHVCDTCKRKVASSMTKCRVEAL